mmetsp:Transcript_41135/g.95288  ORF Transcript_41135/g.95288 Transcript_41135/m.95288 type:complete len:204 (+) Transcript_41135:263-874(+)
MVVEVVEDAITAQKNQVTLLDREGVQVGVAGHILPSACCLLQCLDKLLLPLPPQLFEVRRARQARQLVWAVELVLLLHRAVHNVSAANVGGATGLPTDVSQPRVPQVGHAHLSSRAVHCRHNRSGRAERLGRGIALGEESSHALLGRKRHDALGVLCRTAGSRHELVSEGARVQAEAPLPLTHAVCNPDSRAVGADEEAVLSP